jgi:cobalt-zinc-cadmium efflux system membrane fusion protein
MMLRFMVRGLVLGLILCSSVEAGPILHLDAEAIQHLDLKTALPQQIGAIPLAQAPARVVIPPANEFAVTSLQSGIVTRVNVPLGVSVKKGEILAEIDSIALVDLQRALVDAQSVLSLSESKMRRDDALLHEGVIAKVRWQETKSDFERAKSAARASEQALLASGLSAQEIQQLKAGRAISGSYRVASPTDGVVLERLAIVGQKVDALSPLFRVGKLDELWLEVDMPQELLKEAQAGDRVGIENPRASAQVIEISQNVNPQNQTALIRARINEGAEFLKPGMHVNAELMHRSTDRILKVPLAAVFNHEGRQYVFVQRAQGFEASEVALAGEEAHYAVIHEGLSGTEPVVTQGVAGLKSKWLEAQSAPAE